MGEVRGLPDLGQQGPQDIPINRRFGSGFQLAKSGGTPRVALDGDELAPPLEEAAQRNDRALRGGLLNRLVEVLDVSSAGTRARSERPRYEARMG